MLEELLGSKSRALVIGALLVAPERTLHLRAIARAAGGSVSSAQREIERLETMGLVDVQVDERGRKQVALVPEHPFADPLASMLAADPKAQYRARSSAVSGLDPRVALTLEGWVDDIVAGFDPVRIVLFGSHARGAAGPESDVDLLVQLPQVVDKTETAVEIKTAVGPRTLALDVVLTDAADIERQRGRKASVVNTALAEGTVIYARPA